MPKISHCVLFAALLLIATPVWPADIPAQLPDPSGEPGDATKPVKVYILAGQSNMVGMGDLSGAKNIYYRGLPQLRSRRPRGPDSDLSRRQLQGLEAECLSAGRHADRKPDCRRAA